MLPLEFGHHWSRAQKCWPLFNRRFAERLGLMGKETGKPLQRTVRGRVVIAHPAGPFP